MMLANKHTVTTSVSLNPFFFFFFHLQTFALKKNNFPLTKKKKIKKNVQNIIE